MSYSVGSIPPIISARGPKALAAYERALKFGRIHDKRVKVSLIGQDRVGKTSLGRSLKGEQFNKEEPSTDGVEMNSPIKNAGTQAWKNLTSQQHTTAFDHKCAELIAREVKERSTEQKPSEKFVKKANEEQTEELVVNENGMSHFCLRPLVFFFDLKFGVTSIALLRPHNHLCIPYRILSLLFRMIAIKIAIIRGV